MAKYCMNCGYQMEDSAVFCMRCGQAAEAVRMEPRPKNAQALCPYCGRALDPKNRFCTGCGRPVSAQQDNVQAQTKPSQPQPMQSRQQTQQGVQPQLRTQPQQPVQQKPQAQQPVQKRPVSKDQTPQPAQPQPRTPQAQQLHQQPQQPAGASPARTAAPAAAAVPAAAAAQTVQRAAAKITGFTRRIDFPEGQKQVGFELLPDAASGSGAAATISRIQNPFVTLFGGFKTLVSGFPKLFQNPKALILAIGMTVFWIVFGIIDWAGKSNLFTDILSWPIYAKGGLRGGFFGVIGGIVGKGLVGAGFSTLICGGAKRLIPGIKGIFSGESRLFRKGGLNLGSLLLGFGLAGLFYVFTAGNAGRGGSMVGISGIFLSLSSITNKTGFIRSFASSLSARIRQGSSEKALVPQQYTSFLSGTTGGFALFTSLSGIFGLRETGFVWYIILILFIAAGIVLLLLGNKRSAAGRAAAVLAALLLFLMNSVLFSVPVRADSKEKTGYWTLEETYTEMNDALIEGARSDLLLEGSAETGFHYRQTIIEDGYRFSYTNLDEREHGGGSCKGEFSDWVYTFSQPPQRIEGGTELEIEADVSCTYSWPHPLANCAQVMIACLSAPDSNGYSYFRDSDDRYVILAVERWVQEGKGTSGYGAYIDPFHGTFKATIPKGNSGWGYKEDLYIRFDCSGGGSYKLTTYYHYKWVDTTPAEVLPAEDSSEETEEPENEPDSEEEPEPEKDTESESSEWEPIIQTTEEDAWVNPGEDEGTDIISLIVTGVLGTAVGAAAIGASTEDEKKKKSFKMYIYKEFGNTIRPGERVPVYARIAEIGEGGEVDRPDLSRSIVIRNHDEVFVTEMQAALAGSYKCATVEVSPEQEVSNEGVIDFIYRGEGGVFINMVTFRVKMPEIIFYQDNMALVAKDDQGAGIGFTVDGLDPEKIDIDLRFTEGESYETELVQAVTDQDEKIPGTYFALLADINEDPGEPGTYALHTLQVTATDGRYTAVGEFPVYRVTLGLYVGAEMLNCYRILKKSAIGKEAWDLEASDFEIAWTSVPAMVVCVNEEEHYMYYKPVQPKFTLTPLDPEDSLQQERLDGLGIEAKLVDTGDSISEYAFYCTKCFLEPPLRLRVKLHAECFDSETGEKYSCDKTVLLLSQPYQKTPTISQLEFDDKVREWLHNAQNIMEDVPGLMDQMCCEYVLMTDLWMGYDEHFGYDPILIAQLQKNFETAVFRARRLALKERQDMFLLYDKSYKHDDSMWAAISKSFAMVSEDYLDTWGGIAVRMALGMVTSGLSEVPFTAMDVNKALNDYREETPLHERTWGRTLYVGLKPVIIAGAMASVFKAVGFVMGGIRANIPGSVRFRIGRYVVSANRAVIRRLPLKLQTALKKTDKAIRLVNNGLKELAHEINSYDPRVKWRAQREAAAAAKAENAAAKIQAEKDALMMRNAPRSEKGKVMDTLQQAGELDGAKKVDRFKKAVDRWNSGDRSGAAAGELRDAYFEVNKSTYAQNALEFDGKTAGEIAKKAKIPNRYIRFYNECKAQYLDDRAAPLIKRKAAKIAGVSEDDVIVYRATGKTAEDMNFKVSHDSDNSVLINDRRTHSTYYMSRVDSDQAVYTAHCEATGQSYTSIADAKQKCAAMKVVNVTPDHPEAYREFQKLKTVNAVSERGMLDNMETAKFKMTNDIREMDRGVDLLMADKKEMARALDECRRFNLREIPELSKETMKWVNYTEKGMEGYHQIPKTYDLNAGKDIYAQSAGMKSGFTEQSRLTVERCRLVENQGPHRISMGEMHDLLEMQGTTHEKMMSDMVLDFRTINNNVRTANQSSSWFMDPDPGSSTMGGLQGLSGGLLNGQKE